MFVKRTTFMLYAIEWNRKKIQENDFGDKKDANDSHRKILKYASTKQYNSGNISEVTTLKHSQLFTNNDSTFSQHCSNISNKFLKSIFISNIFLLFLLKNTCLSNLICPAFHLTFSRFCIIYSGNILNFTVYQ